MERGHAITVLSKQIKRYAQDLILAGFDSNSLGSLHHYDGSKEDQINLIGVHSLGIDIGYPCTNANGIKSEVLHTAAQLSQLFIDAATYKHTVLSKCRTLRNNLNLLTDQELIDYDIDVRYNAL